MYTKKLTVNNTPKWRFLICGLTALLLGNNAYAWTHCKTETPPRTANLPALFATSRMYDHEPIEEETGAILIQFTCQTNNNYDSTFDYKITVQEPGHSVNVYGRPAFMFPFPELAPTRAPKELGFYYYGYISSGSEYSSGSIKINAQSTTIKNIPVTKVKNTFSFMLYVGTIKEGSLGYTSNFRGSGTITVQPIPSEGANQNDYYGDEVVVKKTRFIMFPED